jgi:hypothetical protein
MISHPTTPFSARLDTRLVERLKARSAGNGVSASQLAAQFIDEGLRSEEFPGIVFRPGPAGRRAGLVGGPDVWEIVRDLRAAREVGSAAEFAVVASASELAEAQVRLAAAYHGAYPEEIDARIADEEDLIAKLLAGVA